MIDRTGNSALAKQMCLVCGRRLFEADMEVMSVADVPNKRNLVPHHPHPAHKLVGEWLFHEEALEEGTTYICRQCEAKLGLKGNVSTYRLNTAQIAGMISGNTMPPSSRILAATIGVTFVGARNIPLHENIANNPLYAKIEISEEQLRMLPVNGVPEEILRNTRYSNDVAGLEREQAGYIPPDAADEVNEEEAAELGPQRLTQYPEADVFPLQAHGVVDVAGESVPDSELVAHALANVSAPAVQKDFLIRKSSAFVNEWARRDDDGNRFDGGPENPNHVLGAFPVLFPDVNVSYEAHVRWALECDLRFIFQVFGVIQKRQRSAFIANKVSFMKLRPADLLKASAEETRRVPISNPVIRTLRKQLTSLRARVCATDESRISIRAQVIWCTLSFPDTSDPVAQVLAGAAIDLDNFIETAGPDSAKRSATIAGDPFAAAQFFHLTVQAILEDSAPKRAPGIVGIAQARGAPSSAAMKAALETEAFRRKVTAFLKETIRADIAGTTAETVMQIPKKPSLAYSRPVDPREAEAEATIARVVQVHSCGPNTCERVQNGRIVCKRRAPWPLASDDWIHPSGEWGPRRVYGRMNASNQDMKIVTNGQDTKDITFYITMYIAKKQNQASNASALLAKSYAFQRKNVNDEAQARDLNRRMIQQCANTLSREQELSGAEVVSYLMGWGDRFISHNFSPIYWDEVASALKRMYPALEESK
ncbi:hypothetical protein C8R46DRAFT_1160285 [Mycena filopes]|nr:hypothetical protein C8R46DRAFT_1160285 [Mycena filopes]